MIEITTQTTLRCSGCGLSKIVNADAPKDKARIKLDFEKLHKLCDSGSKQQNVEGGK